MVLLIRMTVSDSVYMLVCRQIGWRFRQVHIYANYRRMDWQVCLNEIKVAMFQLLQKGFVSLYEVMEYQDTKERSCRKMKKATTKPCRQTNLTIVFRSIILSHSIYYLRVTRSGFCRTFERYAGLSNNNFLYIYTTFSWTTALLFVLLIAPSHHHLRLPMPSHRHLSLEIVNAKSSAIEIDNVSSLSLVISYAKSF